MLGLQIVHMTLSKSETILNYQGQGRNYTICAADARHRGLRPPGAHWGN